VLAANWTPALTSMEMFKVTPNVLDRNFETEHPNQKWLTDITYIRIQEGWLYLARVLDLYSRRIVGWAMSNRMTSELTHTALTMLTLL
jgi:putative transposase